MPLWHTIAVNASPHMPMGRVAKRHLSHHYGDVELGKRIGANIKAAREAKGWSLERVAARCVPPVAYTTISRFEKGQRALTLDWVEKIANALQVDPAELLDGKPVAPGQAVQLSEQVANEVARSLATVALEGVEPAPGTVQVLSLMLQELIQTFSAFPQAYRDPDIARPVVDLATRRSVLAAK